MLTGIMVVCTVVINSGVISLDLKTVMIKARSVAECHKYSNENGGTGLVAHAKSYDLSKPNEAKEFEVQCGPEGRDCQNANGKPRAKYNSETKQWELIPYV